MPHSKWTTAPQPSAATNTSHYCSPFSITALRLSVTAHCLLSLCTACSHSPCLPVTDPPLSITVYLPPPNNAHPFLLHFTSSYHCPLLLITAQRFLSLPTASYFNYTLRLVVSWSLQHYFIPLCNLKHCIAHFISYAKNIRYFLKPCCT